MLLALLLAVLLDVAAPGHLYVHMDPGYEVVLDGRSAGVTGADAGGRIIDLAPGRHHVVVRSADGREGSFDVDIASGQTTDVRTSPLGLRKKITTSSDPGSLHVTCVPEDCSVTFRDKDRMTHDDTIDNVPAGKYPLIASRGETSLRSTVDILAATAITIEANFRTGTMRVVETRPRPHHLVIVETNDALATLNVPAFWKSAIRSALPAGVSVVRAVVVPNNGIRASLHAPSNDLEYQAMIGLMRSTTFARITTHGARRDSNGWILDYTFYFPTEE
jgi:hypothetical protein